MVDSDVTRRTVRAAIAAARRLRGLPPDLARRLDDLLAELRGPADGEDPGTATEAVRDLDARVRALSGRCWEVLEGLHRGDGEKQIADRLGLSVHTVHHYVKLLYRAFQVRSRGELLSLWLAAPVPAPPAPGLCGDRPPAAGSSRRRRRHAQSAPTVRVTAREARRAS